MKQKYLLPCSCGKNIPVDVGQAGQMVTCACGAAIEVPTMLQLRKLRRVPVESTGQKPRSRWGPRQQMISIGGLLVVGSIVWVCLLWHNWPQPQSASLDVDVLAAEYDEAPAAEVWRHWRRVSQPLPEQLDETYFAARRAQWRWVGLASILGVIGIGLIAGSFWMLKPAAGKRRISAQND